MALPRFIFNSNNLDFPHRISEMRFHPMHRAVLNFSPAGLAAASFSGKQDDLVIRISRFTSRDFYAQLLTWWQWAGQRKPFAFALDSAKVYSAGITTSSGLSATACIVADNTGISVGDYMRLINVADTGEDFLRVTGTVGSTVVNYVGFPNRFSHPTGSILRHMDYFPKLVAMDDEFPVTEEIAGTFTFDLHAKEDKS